MEEAAKQLALLPFWTALSAAERDMAARAAFLRRYDRGQPIYEGGSGCLGLVCVVSGGVRAYLLSEEGREVTLFRLAPGDVCVLSASCVIQQITFDLHIAAERACELLVLPAEAFERLEDSCEAVRGGWPPHPRSPGGRPPARPCPVSCWGARPPASPPRWRPCKGCCSSGSTGGWPGSCWPKAKKTACARCV